MVSISDEKPVPSPRRQPRAAPVAVAQVNLRGSDNFLPGERFHKYRTDSIHEYLLNYKSLQAQ